MKTDDLISALSADLAPVPKRAATRHILLGLGIGVAISIALLVLWLGLRADLMHAMATGAFWMKFVFALSVAALGFGLIDRLARPGGDGGIFGPLILAPLAVMIVLAGYQLFAAPRPMWMPMMMGHSSQVCARNIIVLSLPVFVGVFWSLRALAPTRLTLAGAAAGLLAGATGTMVYCFYCNETTAPFVAIWYTVGIGAMGLLGAAFGRLMLRW